MARAFLPIRASVMDLEAETLAILNRGVMAQVWLDWCRTVNEAVNATIFNRFALADQPTTLAAPDAGYLAFVTDYGHWVRWSGAGWEFAPGDPGNGYFEDFAIVPQQVGWKQCDGTATDYLTVGPTLTATPFNTPNLTGNPAYRKSAAAYAGLAAAVAPGISGATADESTHTHGPGTLTTDTPFLNTFSVAAGVDAVCSTSAHFHNVGSGVTGAGAAHGHGVGTLAVDATADPQHLNVVVYFRR